MTVVREGFDVGWIERRTTIHQVALVVDVLTTACRGVGAPSGEIALG